MRHFPKSLVLFCFLITLNQFLRSQNLLILERPGTIKNYKYELNDPVKLKTIVNDSLISGKLTMIDDSTIIINQITPVRLSDIGRVYRTCWGFTFLQGLFLTTGVPYLLISTINGIIILKTG